MPPRACPPLPCASWGARNACTTAAPGLAARVLHVYNSMQYMQQPERVLAEVYRVLKPGGVCIVTFSNRLFYTKVGGRWPGRLRGLCAAC